MQTHIGYCTNVHAGNTLEETRANLRRHAMTVRRNLETLLPEPTRTMGLGLWLAASVAEQLAAEPRLADELAHELADAGIIPFTLNGFPYGDFHRAVVKHDVYFPTWWDPRRARYTRQLVDILDRLLPEGEEGSISTLPISWGFPAPSESQWRAAAEQLLTVARHLADLESRRGRHIELAIEPEPGCALQRSADIVRFFERYLRPRDRTLAERYLGVCHDVCHAVVMFEAQEDVLRLYQQAGIRIGKMQVSSAVCMPLHDRDEASRAAAIEQLRSFQEERYLHQTVVRNGQAETFFEDLPLALGYHSGAADLGDEWRVHFHVPIYLESFGALLASRGDIERSIQLAHDLRLTNHFEVETYAWNVLPDGLRVPTLADGITRELAWFHAAWQHAASKSGSGPSA